MTSRTGSKSCHQRWLVAPSGSGPIWGSDQYGDQLGAAFPRDRQRRAGSDRGLSPKKIAGPHRDWLVQRCRKADFTLRGLVAELAERGLNVDYHTVWDFVTPRSSVIKKDADCRRARSPRRARRRAQWSKYRERIAPSRLVFIDETWTKTNMAPLRGWAPRGQRIKAKVPHGRWQTMTFLAALRHDRITAPWFFDGPINGEAFSCTSRTSWSHTTARRYRDHGQSRLAQRRRYPPRHPAPARASSSSLNTRPIQPIEQFFSKLKHWLARPQSEPPSRLSRIVHPRHLSSTDAQNPTVILNLIPSALIGTVSSELQNRVPPSRGRGSAKPSAHGPAGRQPVVIRP